MNYLDIVIGIIFIICIKIIYYKIKIIYKKYIQRCVINDVIIKLKNKIPETTILHKGIGCPDGSDDDMLIFEVLNVSDNIYEKINNYDT